MIQHLKIEPQKDGGFVATSTVWADCYAQGDSVEERLKIPLKLTKENISSSPITVPVIVSA